MPIISTLDPHANVSAAMVAATNALITYRTNPHLDQHARGLEAAALMARTLRGEVWPVQAAVLTPVSINIERQHTIESPCADLQNKAREIATRPGVLSTSIILGFPYADVVEMGSGAIVVADRDQVLADRLAGELGQMLLDRREDLVGHMISPADSLARAAELPGPVCLLEMGDNVGGGSPGDGMTLAHLLHKAGKKSFVCLYDPAAVAKAFAAGVNAEVQFEMGGHSGNPYGPPLVATVKVRTLTDGKFTDLRPRHGGTTHYDIGNTAVVELASGLTLMLTTRRAFPVSIVQLTSCGLDPKTFDIIVAKGVHAPVTAYAEVCKSFIRVNTPGMTSANMAAFNYQHRRRPLFPFEKLSDGIDHHIYRGHRV